MTEAYISPNPIGHYIHGQDRREQLVQLGWWHSIPLAVVPAHWLYSGEQRLDGGYYAEKAAAALRLVRDSQFEISDLALITDSISYPGRFKRVYAASSEGGVPFLTASEMLQFRPKSDEYLANSTEAVAICRVEPGWLVVTRSGTVGRCVIVGKRLSQFAITDDAIRVVASSVPIGYLYAYLSTWIGQTLITKDQYGSAINHLEPHHLAGIPVPLVSFQDQRTIHSDVMQAVRLRDEANLLLDEANSTLHETLGIPSFDLKLVPYLSLPRSAGGNRPEQPHPKAFCAKVSDLNDRLDASYHVPVVRTVTELLSKGAYPSVSLSELTRDILIPPRFKRIYVQKEYGVPFLRPAHLPQTRPFDLGHISRLTAVLDQLLFKMGDVLVTTDGTVGRISIVTSQISGWAGSNNIARITYGAGDFRNGYLAAFLATPYGYYQLAREIYGGVVDHIDESQIESLLVPNPPAELQVRIGKLVLAAYEMRDKASRIEEDAIQKVEAILQATSK